MIKAEAKAKVKVEAKRWVFRDERRVVGDENSAYSVSLRLRELKRWEVRD